MDESNSAAQYQLASLENWQITNDSIMGGLSTGSISSINEHTVFSGSISTENNGGFTSIFKLICTLSDKINTVKIKVRGDGNDYQLRFRSQLTGYAMSYKIDFSTLPNTVSIHTFNLSDFTANFRGRKIENAPELPPPAITHVGFLIKSKQPKDFSLSIHSVTFND